MQVQVGENLGADAHFPLRLSFCVKQGGEFAAAMEAEGGAVADFLDGVVFCCKKIFWNLKKFPKNTYFNIYNKCFNIKINMKLN